MNHAIRILLVDEHEPVRYRVQQMLEQEEDMKVVGDYASVGETSSELARLQPDIVLMDVQMPGISGTGTARLLRKNGLSCNAGVILVTEGRSCRAEALEDGVADSLVKDWECPEITGVIREVYRNKQMPVVRDVSTGGVVKLVIDPPPDSARLLKFLCQLQSILGDNSGIIQQVVGSGKKGIVVTISLRSITTTGLINRLAGISGVEMVDEELLRGDTFPDLSQKFGIPAGLGASRGKWLRVILKGAGVVRPALANVMK